MAAELTPRELRELIRKGQWTRPTSGASKGHIQANLVMMPQEQAFNFLLFCVRNPKPCPLLDVLEPGRFEPGIAPGADLRTDLPRYRIYENGRLKTEVPDVSAYAHSGMVSFCWAAASRLKTPCWPRACPSATSRRAKTCPCNVTQRDCRPGRAVHLEAGGDHAAMTPQQARAGRADHHALSPDPRRAGTPRRLS